MIEVGHIGILENLSFSELLISYFHEPLLSFKGMSLEDASNTNVTQGGSTGHGHTIRETVRNAFSQMGEPVTVPVIPYKPKPIVQVVSAPFGNLNRVRSYMQPDP